jgi:hypothetical protein
MASHYKILGQAAPTDTNTADAYTVPLLTDTIVSSIVVANTTATSANARVFVRNNGATAATSNAVVYDVAVAANSTIALTLGITIDAGDVISVRTSTANALTFHVFGQEIA